MNQFQEHLNKEFNEIKKTMQNVKEEFNKAIKSLQKSN
jgi:hypothetical protein